MHSCNRRMNNIPQAQCTDGWWQAGSPVRYQLLVAAGCCSHRHTDDASLPAMLGCSIGQRQHAANTLSIQVTLGELQPASQGINLLHVQVHCELVQCWTGAVAGQKGVAYSNLQKRRNASAASWPCNQCNQPTSCHWPGVHSRDANLLGAAKSINTRGDLVVSSMFPCNRVVFLLLMDRTTAKALPIQSRLW